MIQWMKNLSIFLAEHSDTIEFDKIRKIIDISIEN